MKRHEFLVTIDADDSKLTALEVREYIKDALEYSVEIGEIISVRQPGQPLVEREPLPQCEHRFTGRTSGVQCCLKKGHAWSHCYKCAVSTCPGLGWPASEAPHPCK